MSKLEEAIISSKAGFIKQIMIASLTVTIANPSQVDSTFSETNHYPKVKKYSINKVTSLDTYSKLKWWEYLKESISIKPRCWMDLRK